MARFKELLSGSLEGLNNGFEQAKQELEEVVGELDSALNEQFDTPRASIEVDEVWANLEGSLYRIVGKAGTTRHRTDISYLLVSRNGYPINYGYYDATEKEFTREGSLTDRANLEEYFEEMLNDKSSPIVLFAAFLQRE